MPRTTKGAARKRKHKKILKGVRGMRGAISRRIKLAITATYRAGVYATRDRRTRKRNFRGLWIVRLSAACRQRGIRYSQFINGLELAGITLNRKMLSEMAIADPSAFDAVAEKVKAHLPAAG